MPHCANAFGFLYATRTRMPRFDAPRTKNPDLLCAELCVNSTFPFYHPLDADESRQLPVRHAGPSYFAAYP